jgi:hypothetical protein
MNVESRVELLKIEDLPRIQKNVNKYLQYVGCCPDMYSINIVRLQLAKLLAQHLNAEAARSLVGNVVLEYRQYTAKAVSPARFHTYFTYLVESWPESIAQATDDTPTSRWLRLLGMEKIKETPLRDFFTGYFKDTTPAAAYCFGVWSAQRF